MQQPPTNLRTYRVAVGHSEVVVEAKSPREAIRLARRELAQELPRFYDVISSLEEDRFKVDHAA